MVGAGMLVGAGVGFGLLLIVRGVAAGPPPLSKELERLRPVRDPHGDATAAGDVGIRLAGWFGERLQDAGIEVSGAQADLAVVGRSQERHLVDKLAAATTGFAVPVAAATAVAAIGGIAVPVLLVAVVASGLAIGGFVLPDVLLRDQAEERRRSLRFALSAYLDLVQVILAAGGGVETALGDAAQAGSGWSFQRLDAALRRARLTGHSPWEAFGRLGVELDVPELRETAASLTVAGTHGAKVRESLRARSQALRARDLTDMHAQAEAATERMSVPTVVLVVGFIVFVGFPAAHRIIGF